METTLPYQIPIQQYPKMLRYRISERGLYHMEDLISEVYVEENEASMHKLVTLGILLRVNMCQTMNLENESLYQDVSGRAAKFGGVEPEYLAECIKSLSMRGLLEPNPRYDKSIALVLRGAA